MTRGQSKNHTHKNKAKLSQTPKQEIVSDGIDEEYSAELADQDDIEAQERAAAADKRAQQ
ncbi:YfhD family protein [Shouchella patagoniensis]|uniref:YfhD family protein n=1 Tax=Shouchella patagoniensis TaxID=228576 RepID=UPI0009958C55|nr:YfhD family protein [Shouchella patagoniensis]